MERDKNLSKARVLFSASLVFFTLSAFAQSKVGLSAKSRPEVNYKQLHSASLGNQERLFADGIKLKMDLSVLEEAEAAREAFDINEIPKQA